MDGPLFAAALRGRRHGGRFARIHWTLGVTPAMAAGISDHVWSMEEVGRTSLRDPKVAFVNRQH